MHLAILIMAGVRHSGPVPPCSSTPGNADAPVQIWSNDCGRFDRDQSPTKPRIGFDRIDY
jgi:hypothetical protein